MLKVGERAMRFSLPNKEGKLVSLEDLLGKWIVLYFYPKDNTSGCTLEAIEFTNLLKEFEDLDAVVLGVSRDSIKSHQKFAKKHSLTIELLSDEEASIIKAYGAWGKKKMYGKEYEGIVRSTFIINPEGYITYVFKDVKPKGHAEEVLKKLKELQRNK